MAQTQIPQWLIADEQYKPVPDKDAFINKSIIALLRILSKIRTQGEHIDPFRVSAPVKVVCTLILIVLISLSREYSFVIISNIYVLLLLSFMSGDEIIRILRVSFIVLLFSAIILLPSALFGNYYSIFMISAKIFATVTLVNILARSTPWNEITRSLKIFHVPDIFILVLDITIRYISMLGEFSLNMLYALRARSIGRNSGKYGTLSGVAGTLFIRSVEMSQELYSAMECRGFTGKYRQRIRWSFRIVDAVFIAVNSGIVFLFFIMKG